MITDCREEKSVSAHTYTTCSHTCVLLMVSTTHPKIKYFITADIYHKHVETKKKYVCIMI